MVPRARPPGGHDRSGGSIESSHVRGRRRHPGLGNSPSSVQKRHVYQYVLVWRMKGITHHRAALGLGGGGGGERGHPRTHPGRAVGRRRHSLSIWGARRSARWTNAAAGASLTARHDSSAVPAFSCQALHQHLYFYFYDNAYAPPPPHQRFVALWKVL